MLPTLIRSGFDGVTPTHTHTHKMCSSQIIGVIMSHFLSCHNFCKIVSLHRVENPLLTVITVTSMIDIWLMNLSKKKSSAPEFVLSFQQCLGSWSGLLKRCSPLSLLLGPYCLLLFQWPRTLPSLTACYFRVRFRYLCLYVLENDVVFIMKGSEGNLARTKLYVFGGFSRCLHQCSYIMKLNMCESWRRLQYTIHETHPSPQKVTTHTHPTSCVASSICASSSNVNILPHPTQNTAPCDLFNHTSSVTGLQWC